MNKVSREAIKQLLETEDSVTLSMYMPSHRFPTSDHISEDQIRLKNLMKSAKETLEEQGTQGGLVTQMMDQIQDTIYDSVDFWQRATEGVAIFCAPAGVHYFHLPIECDEYVSVGDSYDVGPLLAIASYDQPYYILALAVKDPVLLKGDMYSVEKVDIELPKSPAEALNIDELYSNSQTIRTGGHGAGAKAHGQGDTRQAGQEERLKFFRMIDEKIVSSKIVDKKTPVLLAGTDEDVSGYKESSRMKNLLDSTLSGNYTDIPLHETHRRSWPLVSNELCEEERVSVIEKVQSLLGTGKASTDPNTIADAAAEGKVATLVAGLITVTKDSITDSNETIKKLSLTDIYKSNKIGKSARRVFDQGGAVLLTTKELMPSQVPVAAVFRY